jgi:small subunit ribosomal protein S13
MAEQIKNLIRIANTDIVGEKTIPHGLTKIKGIGKAFSDALCEVLNLDKKQKIGSLNEKNVKEIESAINNPKEKNMPTWLYNRKFDYNTGEDKHLTGPTLKLTQDFDLRRMKKIKSYKGIRHMFGLPARGQKTKGNFRKGKSVGVVKKKK